MTESELEAKSHEDGVTKPVTDKTQIIGDDLKVYINISLNISLTFIISSLGIVTNIFNVVVFLKLGLKDSMSVELFVLSLTDLLATSFQLAISICYLVDLLYPNNPVNVWYFGYSTFAYMFNICYQVSCWITAILSVERCFCVVSPFKVKQIFTRFRCIIIMLTIYLIHVAFHIPIFVADTDIRAESVPLLPNNTATETPMPMVSNLLDQEVPLIQIILELTTTVGLGILCQTIVIVSAVWMSFALEASSKCRTHPSVFEPRLSSQRQQSSSSRPGSTLSNRERRLVKVVLSLAITLSVFNVPKIIVVILTYFCPELSYFRESNLNSTMWALANAYSALNCSINIFWYMKLNTSYREAFNKFWKTK